jgi:PKD repeat protein
MRLPWFFNPHKRCNHGGGARRRKGSSLRVRPLERRRVLNASIQSIAVPAAANEGSLVTATANATGQGQLTYDWSLTQGNTTLATGANASFSFTPPDDGNYDVNLKVTDNSPVSDSKSVALLVKNQPPVLVVANNQTVNEGQLLDLTGNGSPILGVFVDDGKLDTHTATVDWGDGSPVGPAVVSEANGSGAVTGSHTYADDGVYMVKVTVFDNANATSGAQMFNVTVKNQQPVLVVAGDQTVNEGQLLDLSGNGNPILGLFVDDGKLDTHTATVDWGDGSPVGPAVVSEAIGSGAVTGSHTYADDGTYQVTVTVFDNFGDKDTKSFDVTVNNVAPQLINVTGSTIDENGVATVTGTIQDPGTLDTFEVDVNWQDNVSDKITGLGSSDASGFVGDTGYEWTAATREIKLTHQYVDDGPSPGNGTASDAYHVALTVIDNHSDSGSAMADVIVNNVRPVLVVAADQMVNEGQLLDLSGQGAPILGLFIDTGTHDKHTATVDWGDGSGVQSPTLSEAAGSGALTGTHTYVDDGVYTVSVTVSDDDLGTSDVETFKVTVKNVSPTAQLSNSGPINEGSSGLVTFSNQFDPSPVDTAAGFHYAYDLNNDGTFDVGDGSYAGSGTNAVQSVPGSILVDGPGDYTVKGRILDKDGGFTDYTTVIHVENVPPVLTVAVDQSVNEGQLLDLTGNGNPILGLFVDDGKLDTHTATVDWGDGSPVEAALVNEANGAGALTGSHTYADNGNYTVTVVVTDNNGGSSNIGVFHVLVSNVDPTAMLSSNGPINEGSSGLVTFSNQFDPSPIDTAAGFHYAYDLNNDGTFDVGDGSYAGSVISAGAVVPGSILVDGPGDYTVKARILDKDGGFTDYTTVVHVNNVPPVLTVAADQSVNEGQLLDLTGNGNPLLGLFVDDGKVDTHTATVDWGDGTGTQATTVLEIVGTGSGVVEGSHTYADNGFYTVTVSVTDKDGGISNVGVFHVTVNNVAPSLTATGDKTIDEGSLLSITDIGTFTDPGFDNPLNTLDPANGGETTETFTYSINWDDGTPADTGTATVDVHGSVGVLTAGSFDGSHTYADNGTYTVKLTVTDDDSGVSNVAVFHVTVNNVAPTLTATGDKTIDEGSLLSITDIGTFTDPGFDNSLNTLDPTNGGETTETFTYSINWDDGTPADTGSATVDIHGSVGVLTAGSFDGSHTYADNGTYTVKLTVTDDDSGVSNIATFHVTVNNVDPTLTGTSNLSVNEGSAFTLTGLGVGLSDPGFDNPLNTLDPSNGGEVAETFPSASFTIDWGDGTATDTAVTIVNRVSGSPGVPTTAQFSHAPHTYADNGFYNVTITVQDDDGPVVARTFHFTVNNVVPTLTATGNKTVDEASLLSITDLGTLTDPGFDNPLNTLDPSNGGQTHETFTYSINWDDGTSTDTGSATVDIHGSPGVLTAGSFDGSHTYADNGVYTVIVRIADDDMSGNFTAGTNGVDYVEQTFTVTVNNVLPTFIPTMSGASFEGDNLNIQGITSVRVGYTDPGYDNPLNNPLTNTGPANGGQTAETPVYVVDWGDGTIDAMHHYATDGSYTVTVTATPDGGASQTFTFSGFNSSANPVLTIVNGQTLNGPQTMYTYVINWGEQAVTGGADAVTTLHLSLASPGNPVVNTGNPAVDKGLTSVLSTARASGGPSVLTTGTSEIQHQYLGPPDPLHPTADIQITMIVADDDNGQISDFIAVKNPGIETQMVAIDTTPDVARLEFATTPPVIQPAAGQNSVTSLVDTNDNHAAAGDTAATSDRYLELRVVYPDGTEGQGYRIKDEALNDLRGFFKTLPDGKYRVYLVRTENNSRRLVIEVSVRRGHVIAVPDESEGTRDRPPTSEDQAPPAKPLNENPQLIPVPGGFGDDSAVKPTNLVESAQNDCGLRIADCGLAGVASQQSEIRNPKSEISPLTRSAASLAALGLAASARPWSEEVDAALAAADPRSWQRLRRAGRRGLMRPQSNRRLPANTTRLVS